MDEREKIVAWLKGLADADMKRAAGMASRGIYHAAASYKLQADFYTATATAIERGEHIDDDFVTIKRETME